jgi:hypothetical protein
VPTCLQVTADFEVAIAEQHWVLGLVSFNAGRVTRHNVRAVQEIGDSSEALRLTLQSTRQQHQAAPGSSSSTRQQQQQQQDFSAGLATNGSFLLICCLKKEIICQELFQSQAAAGSISLKPKEHQKP